MPTQYVTMEENTNPLVPTPVSELPHDVRNPTDENKQINAPQA